MFLPFADATRLAAVVVAPGCAKHEIRKTLADRIDPAFMPRPLILAHSLSRDGNGKLPIGGACVVAGSRERDCAIGRRWHRDADRLRGGSRRPSGAARAFPGHPIVPGVVLLELVEALLADNGYGVCGCPQVKFLVPVAPQTPLTLRAEISHRTSVRFAIDVAGKSAVVGKFACVPGVVDT